MAFIPHSLSLVIGKKGKYMKVIEYLELKYKDAGVITMTKNELRIFTGEKKPKLVKGWKDTLGQVEITAEMAAKLKQSMTDVAINAKSTKQAYACIALEIL